MNDKDSNQPIKIIDRNGKKYFKYSCGHLHFLDKEGGSIELAQVLVDNYEIILCPECGLDKVKDLQNELSLIIVEE